jgi:hypothetical protein
MQQREPDDECDGVSRRWRAALGLVVPVALAGCSVGSPTPQVIYVTPPPTPIIIYVTPTPAVTPSQVATPSLMVTLTPSPSPTPPAAACTGTADNKAFFTKAARAMNWTVYCAVLPSGWSITKGTYTNAPDGLLDVVYQHGAQEFQLLEGNICGLIAISAVPAAGKRSRWTRGRRHSITWRPSCTRAGPNSS